MVEKESLRDQNVVIKGAGDLASGVAWRLYQANIQKLLMLDIEKPLAVRRAVSFCEALIHGQTLIEGVKAVRAEDLEDIQQAWGLGQIPVLADPSWTIINRTKPDVVVDAILAKRNLGTHINDAPLVIGLGPGFTAGEDVHMVIETKRGHDLGRVILSGTPEPDTGIPGNIGGYSTERVIRAPSEGVFNATKEIGDLVQQGDLIGDIDGGKVKARIDGKIRGLIMSGIHVTKGFKIGDIDPRGAQVSCDTISDKARAIGGGVLEAIMRKFNK